MINRGLSLLTVIILLLFSLGWGVHSIQSDNTGPVVDQKPNLSPHQTSNASWTVMTWINADSEGEHDAMDALQELELVFIPNEEVNVVSSLIETWV